MPGLVWKGDRTWTRKIRARARGKGARRAAVDPWRRWVTQVRIIRMYQDRGVIRTPSGNEGHRWKPNAELTVEIKGGFSRPMLSPEKQFRFGSMVRSYEIKAVPRYRNQWKLKLSNRARAEDGFDYPSYLDEPGSGTIRPIRANVLRAVGAGGEFFMDKVRKPPARPHLYFSDDDAEQLGLRMADWILEGKKSPHRRRVRQ